MKSYKEDELRICIEQYQEAATDYKFLMQCGICEKKQLMELCKSDLVSCLSQMSPIALAPVYREYMHDNELFLYGVGRTIEGFNSPSMFRYASASWGAHAEILKMLRNYRFNIFHDDENFMNDFRNLSSPIEMLEEYAEFATHFVGQDRRILQEVLAEMKYVLVDRINQMSDNERDELIAQLKGMTCEYRELGKENWKKRKNDMIYVGISDSSLRSVVENLCKIQYEFTVNMTRKYNDYNNGLVTLSEDIEAIIGSASMDMDVNEEM